MKRCSTCHEHKEYSEFYLDKNTPTGYSWQCKECHRKASSKSYAKHRDEILARQMPHDDRRRQRDREYYQRHREELLRKQRARAYTIKNRANGAVNDAIKWRRLPKARDMRCVQCGDSASQYHHQSYLREDFLAVLPVCGRCHMALHWSDDWTAKGGLAVVATKHGLLRVAVAGS